MTPEETEAQTFLRAAKDAVKIAFEGLDPSPAEPVAKAMLGALDAIDAASKALAERGK